MNPDTAILTTHDGLLVQVHILGTRQVFGRTDYLVTPTEGSGQVWVQEQRLTFPK